MQGKITGMTTTMTLYTVLYILYRLYPPSSLDWSIAASVFNEIMSRNQFSVHKTNIICRPAFTVFIVVPRSSILKQIGIHGFFKCQEQETAGERARVTSVCKRPCTILFNYKQLSRICTWLDQPKTICDTHNSSASNDAKRSETRKIQLKIMNNHFATYKT